MAQATEVAAVASASAGAALNGNRLSLAMSPRCGGGHAEELTPNLSPTQLAVGGGRNALYAGGVVGNAALGAGALAANYLVARTAHALHRCVPWLRSCELMVVAKGAARFPGASVLASAFLYQGSVLCAAKILLRPVPDPLPATTGGGEPPVSSASNAVSAPLSPFAYGAIGAAGVAAGVALPLWLYWSLRHLRRCA
eukprot:gene34010-16164_t